MIRWFLLSTMEDRRYRTKFKTNMLTASLSVIRVSTEDVLDHSFQALTGFSIFTKNCSFDLCSLSISSKDNHQP
jgi:hypothetical protein